MGFRNIIKDFSIHDLRHTLLEYSFRGCVYIFFEQGQGYFEISKYIAIIVAVLAVLGIFHDLLVLSSIPRPYTQTRFFFLSWLAWLRVCSLAKAAFVLKILLPFLPTTFDYKLSLPHLALQSR